uniref:Uncharacterized protein n=1 Tax=Arundo donax TaxID=35708 RepID=A0A0A8Y0J9_ARUDO
MLACTRALVYKYLRTEIYIDVCPQYRKITH